MFLEVNNERKLNQQREVNHLMLTGDGAFAPLLNSKLYTSNIKQLAGKAHEQFQNVLRDIKNSVSTSKTLCPSTKAKMLPGLLELYYRMVNKQKQSGINVAGLPLIAGYHEAAQPGDDSVIKEYMKRRASPHFGDNKELADYLASHTPSDIFGKSKTTEKLPYEYRQYCEVCRSIGARRQKQERIFSLFNTEQVNTLKACLSSGKFSQIKGLIFVDYTNVSSNNVPWTVQETNRMFLLSLASALYIHDVKRKTDDRISTSLNIQLGAVWDAITEAVEQQEMNKELHSESLRPLGGLCSMVYKPNFDVPFSDAAGICGCHKLKCNGHGIQTQSKEECPCAGIFSKCKYQQQGKICPSSGGICRWSKLNHAARKFKLLQVASILQQAHDKMCTTVYIYLYLNEEFKQCLIKCGFFTEVIYLDAIGDIWSAFSLPELLKFERLARAFKGMVFFHAIIGEQLYTPQVLKSGVLRDTDKWLGISMDNIWESFTNVSAFIGMHISEDGQSWVRLSSVSKMFSNDLVEEFHALVVGVTGNYKARTPDFDAVAKSVDTMALIRMSDEKNHATWVSNKKNYIPADASPRAQRLYNESKKNHIYSAVVEGIFYLAVTKRVLRELKGKYKSIREHYKMYGSSLDPADGLGLAVAEGMSL